MPRTAGYRDRDRCPAACMNAASNSWVEMGAANGPEDPHGYC